MVWVGKIFKIIQFHPRVLQALPSWAGTPQVGFPLFQESDKDIYSLLSCFQHLEIISKWKYLLGKAKCQIHQHQTGVMCKPSQGSSTIPTKQKKFLIKGVVRAASFLNTSIKTTHGLIFIYIYFLYRNILIFLGIQFPAQACTSSFEKIRFEEKKNKKRN